jgi:hypothetical protein
MSSNIVMRCCSFLEAAHYTFTFIIIIIIIINGKKLLSLKPVIRTRRSYKRVGLIKRQESFQRLAVYGHEVLMFLQTRANFLKTQSTTSVTESVIRFQDDLIPCGQRLYFFNVFTITIERSCSQKLLCFC